ncbi:hypothetical protein [Desulfonatronum sp. SC1]|uniref:hypothetical protein n=1 Tax=Desulfonatronum sp. SC1 TaxID=2109626 RepID=UPI000D30A693|nr:hypothetical protein [Desulfonatronum sp. SC1]PTN33037.1 hypothetical protein C6366_15470 [Desulfonatronum sp. SC1]
MKMWRLFFGKAALAFMLCLTGLVMSGEAYSQHWSGGPDNTINCEVIVNDTYGFGLNWGEWYKITVNYWIADQRANDLRYICESMLHQNDIGAKFLCKKEINGTGINSPLHGFPLVGLDLYAGVSQGQACAMLFEKGKIEYR